MYSIPILPPTTPKTGHWLYILYRYCTSIILQFHIIIIYYYLLHAHIGVYVYIYYICMHFITSEFSIPFCIIFPSGVTGGLVFGVEAKPCDGKSFGAGGVFEYSDGGAQRVYTAAVIPTPAIYHAGGRRTRFIPTRGGERSTIAIPRLN